MRSTASRLKICAVLGVVLLTFAADRAYGQAGTATLTGEVKDAQGAVLPGATITVTNTATGGTRTVVSNQSGHYAIPGLPPGNYTVVGTRPGYRDVRREINVVPGAALQPVVVRCEEKI